MVGLILGIIFILAGIGISIACAKISVIEYKRDEHDKYVYDENRNRVKIKVYPYKKWISLILVITIILSAFTIFLGCITTIDTG